MPDNNMTTAGRKRRLKNIDRARFIIWMHTKTIPDSKEQLRHMQAVFYLTKLARKAR